MCGFFKKNYFPIDNPNIKLCNSQSYCIKSLKKHNIPYSDVCSDGSYIVFDGKVLGFEFNLRIGLHFHLNKLQHIELYRPESYYKEINDTEKSFYEIQNALISKFGNPNVDKTSKNDYCDEGFSSKFYLYEWKTNNIIITHSTCERFVLEEHFTIKIL